MLTLAKALQKLESGLPVSQAPELGPAVHWTPAENLPVHRWFRYREGFSPHLLEYFADTKYRLDPFCGCGTTLLESAIHSRNSYGVELNPLATFITRTKTQHYTAAEREAFVEESSEALHQYQTCSPAPPHVPAVFRTVWLVGSPAVW